MVHNSGRNPPFLPTARSNCNVPTSRKSRRRHRSVERDRGGYRRHLAAEGATVVVNYASSKAGADQVVAEITKQAGRRSPCRRSLQAADIRRLFAEAKKAFGRVDILVNNAGIYEFAPIEDITAEHFHKQFDLNVLGLLLATQEAVKHFGPAGGRSSISVRWSPSPANCLRLQRDQGRRGAITRSLAQELGPRKIRVNAVNPGMVETEGTHTAGITESDFRKQIEVADPARPHRPAARHRPGRRLPCLGRLGLDHRRNSLHFRRTSLNGEHELNRQVRQEHQEALICLVLPAWRSWRTWRFTTFLKETRDGRHLVVRFHETGGPEVLKIEELEVRAHQGRRGSHRREGARAQPG